MRLTFGINDHVFVIEATKATMARSGEPDPAEPPAIFYVSRAETQVRPQWDHDGPRPTALGFQPNGVMDADMHSYDSGGRHG